MLLGLFARGEGSEVFALLRLRVYMTGVDTKLSALQFANHLRVPLLACVMH